MNPKLTRRNFLKRFWAVPAVAAIPVLATVPLLAEADVVTDRKGNIIVKRGARGVVLSGNTLTGGSIIIEEDTDNTLVVGTLLTT